MMNKKRSSFVNFCFVIITFMYVSIVGGQTPAPKEKVEAIKSSFQKSQALLRKYEWVETQVVSFKGEEKSNKQSRCYYGADGKLQKVEENQTKADTPGGIRGKIAKKKKEELTDYMLQAIATIKQYVPPDPVLIQKSYQSGHSAIFPSQPGRMTQISFSSYLKQNDSLLFEVDTSSNRVQGVKIQTYIESPKDSVVLNVSYYPFPDGTIYPGRITLDAPAKDVKVTIHNSGYRKAGS